MMRCPTCTNETKVTNSRQKVNNDIHRRRVCNSCGYRFSTIERFRPHGEPDAAGNREVRELLERAIQIIGGEDGENRPLEESAPAPPSVGRSGLPPE